MKQQQVINMKAHFYNKGFRIGVVIGLIIGLIINLKTK